MIKEKMYAIEVEKTSHNLVWKETSRPDPKENQVLVRIHATALNRADLLQRKGLYPPPPGASEILGLEMAGEIVSCGALVKDWSVGARVCCLLEGGGYAEYVACDASMLLPVPDSLSYEEAAALPEVFITAYLNIFIEAAAQKGERVLVHAGASGVGTAAIQLCKALGNPVYATTSTPKLQALEELGVEGVIDRLQGPWKGSLESITNELFDVILDPVGAGYLNDNLSVLNKQGRLVLIGLLSGRHGEIALGKVLLKRIRLIGSVLRSRSRAEKKPIIQELRERVWPLFDEGKLKPIIDCVFSITQANEAHERLATNATIGKVVLSVPSTNHVHS